jgi:putative chitinase
MLDVAKLQTRLKVKPDGAPGPTTLAALFVRSGAMPDLAAELGVGAAVHFRAAGVLETGLRLAHLVAQLGHESDGFRAMEEYASGQAYEGREDLGNVHPGDGRRYKGRGPIQVTGRDNYRRFGRKLGIDLERRPELASAPSIGLMVSCAYWAHHDLNDLADRDDLLMITRRINGGLNGLADRRARLAAARALIL